MRLIGLHAKARSGKDEFGKILQEAYGIEPISFAGKLKELVLKYYNQTPDEVFETRTADSRKILQGVGTMCRQKITYVHGLLTSANSGVIDNEDLYKGTSGYPKWVESLVMEYFYIMDYELKSKRKFIKNVLEGTYSMFMDMHKEFFEISNNQQEKIWINYLISNLSEDGCYVITDVRHKNEKKEIEDLGGKVVKIIRPDSPKIEAGAAHPTEIELDDVVDWFFTVINEHKTDWRESLVLQAGNLIRKLDSLGFFTQEDKAKFRAAIY